MVALSLSLRQWRQQWQLLFINDSIVGCTDIVSEIVPTTVMIIIIHYHLQNWCRSLSTTNDNGADVVVETKSTRRTVCLLFYGDGCNHGIIVSRLIVTMVFEEEEEVPSVLHDWCYCRVEEVPCFISIYINYDIEEVHENWLMTTSPILGERITSVLLRLK